MNNYPTECTHCADDKPHTIGNLEPGEKAKIKALLDMGQRNWKLSTEYPDQEYDDFNYKRKEIGV